MMPGRRMTKEDCRMFDKFKKDDKVIDRDSGTEYLFECYDSCIGGMSWVTNKDGKKTSVRSSLLEWAIS